MPTDFRTGVQFRPPPWIKEKADKVLCLVCFFVRFSMFINSVSYNFFMSPNTQQRPSSKFDYMIQIEDGIVLTVA